MLIETVAVEWVRLQELEKDAARYRWLKRRSWEGTGAIFFASVDCITGESVDAAIDREIENAKTRE